MHFFHGCKAPWVRGNVPVDEQEGTKHPASNLPMGMVFPHFFISCVVIQNNMILKPLI